MTNIWMSLTMDSLDLRFKKNFSEDLKLEAGGVRRETQSILDF